MAFYNEIYNESPLGTLNLNFHESLLFWECKLFLFLCNRYTNFMFVYVIACIFVLNYYHTKHYIKTRGNTLSQNLSLKFKAYLKQYD